MISKVYDLLIEAFMWLSALAIIFTGIAWAAVIFLGLIKLLEEI